MPVHSLLSLVVALRPLLASTWAIGIVLIGSVFAAQTNGLISPVAVPSQQTTLPTSNTGSTFATGAQPPVVTPTDALNVEMVQARLQSIQSNAEMDPALKQQLVGIYEAILVELRAKADQERQTMELAASANAAPSALLDSKRRKENPAPPIDAPSKKQLESFTIEELRQFSQDVQTLLQSASDNRSRVETAISTRENRRKELPRLITEDRDLLRKLGEELALPPPADIDPQVREAQNILLQARRDAIQERLRKRETELRTIDAESELLPLRRDIFQADEKFLQGYFKDISDELNKRREILITNERAKVLELASSTPVELQTDVQRLVKRANDWLDLAQANSKIQLQIESAKSRLSLWSERFKIMSERLQPQSGSEVGGFNSVVGLMLRRQRSDLPDSTMLRNQLRDYQEKMQETETLILELDDWRAQIAALREDVLLPDAILSDTQNQLQSGSLREQYRKLWDTESELIANFRVDAVSYFENLFSLADATQQMLQLVRSYQAFVDRHVLWIRSSDRLDKGEMKQAWPALQWLCQFSHWKQVFGLLLADFREQPWWALMFLALWIVLIFNLKQFRQTIRESSEQVARPTQLSFLPTIKTVIATFLLAAPVSTLLLFVGWRLNLASNKPSFEHAVSMGFLTAARYFYSLEVLRQASRKSGLLESHFGWAENTCRLLRINLRWFADLGALLVGVVAILGHAPEERWDSSLGRICFCILMVLCFVFLAKNFRPKGGIFSNLLDQNRGGWADRLRYVWYSILSATPILFLAMALLGYFYTAQRLAMLSHTTIITMIGILLLHNLVMLWFTLNRKMLIVAQARQRLEEAQRRDPAIPSTIGAFEQPQIDLTESNAQTKRLVNSAIFLIALASVYFIWSGVLPAVSALNAITLWTVQGEAPDKPLIPITLADLLIAIPILVMVFIAARNLPGLLEIALLQHLPLEYAVRYAIATLSRYAILFLGILVMFNTIGIRWSSIQWLVAALGVGLGFGLQEIFANFVSGLILLFEQPIRVGDVITLGDVTGSVTRIRMRATTIVNWDRQELIIPNKDLVTGRLLNWTLTDATNRLKIVLGVKFGTDTNQACSILREICMDHPNVLRDPPPSAFLDGISENALMLTMRAFIGSLDQRLQTRHELLGEIDRRFREVGIVIAYPQRDIHIRSSSGPILDSVPPSRK